MKYSFQNKQNETLSGQLEMPSGQPRAYALFAHCFTCSKDIVAARTIASELTGKGFAVLRFDFTGLGNSQGDFSNTNFSSNVEDLIAACQSLSQTHEAPQLLIGHSLGGAAVLTAAPQMDNVKAVVTIAAPSDAEHVTHLFEQDLDTIEADGEARVSLAGRPFTIKKQFVDDLRQSKVLDALKNLKKSLLVFHSPIDNMVSIDHAANIYLAAKHPKSFVSLDKADHLLMNKKDAEYVAETLAAWASRYVEESSDANSLPTLEHGEVLVSKRPEHMFTQDVFTDHHNFVMDEPKSVKGDDLGATPYQMLLAALGGCTSMTMQMYCNHKGIKLDKVEVKLKHQKIHARDCEDCETETGKVDEIEKSIHIEGDFSPEQKQRILEIAEKCPVNKTLQSEVKVRTTHV